MFSISRLIKNQIEYNFFFFHSIANFSQYPRVGASITTNTVIIFEFPVILQNENYTLQDEWIFQNSHPIE